jgi:hypothetical protein
MITLMYTVLLVVGFAGVSVAQQPVMQIKTYLHPTNGFIRVSIPDSPLIEVPIPRGTDFMNFDILVMKTISGYVEQGWRLLSHTVVSEPHLNHYYTLVKDE